MNVAICDIGDMTAVRFLRYVNREDSALIGQIAEDLDFCRMKFDLNVVCRQSVDISGTNCFLSDGIRCGRRKLDGILGEHVHERVEVAGVERLLHVRYERLDARNICG